MDVLAARLRYSNPKTHNLSVSQHYKHKTNQEEIPMQNQTLPLERRQRCEVWTRVMGYHRPVSAFNKGKQSEHRERQHFTESASR